MLNLKDFLEKFVNNLKLTEQYNKDELTALALFVVYNKPYFKNRFSDFYLYKNQNGQIRLSSPVFNNVSGAAKLHVENFICQNNNHDETEYFYSKSNDFYYLKGSQRNNLISFYKLIKEKNSFKEFKKKFSEYAKFNGQALLDFELIFNDLANPNKHVFYQFLISNFQINKVEHDLHNISFKKRGQIKRMDTSGVNENNFTEIKYYYWKLLRKEMIKINKINSLLKEHQHALSYVLKAIYEKYPIILSNVEKDDLSELKYYLFEVHASDKDDNDFMNFKNKPLKLLTNGFEKTPQNKTLRELLYESPFMMNKDHQNTFNSLEGLIYVNDFNFKNTSNFHHFFIVAKNKYNETIGVLTIQQPSNMKHFCKIGEISIKHNYRNLGVAKKLYSKMAELGINNKLIISNRVYSSMGRLYLPKMKQKIIEEYPELLLINSNLGDVYDFRELNSCIESYNHFLINDVQIQDRCGMLNWDIFKKSYRLGLQHIMKKSELPEFCTHKVKEEALKIFIENNKKP